jgi:hypothetical protein
VAVGWSLALAVGLALAWIAGLDFCPDLDLALPNTRRAQTVEPSRAEPSAAEAGTRSRPAACCGAVRGLAERGAHRAETPFTPALPAEVTHLRLLTSYGRVFTHSAGYAPLRPSAGPDVGGSSAGEKRS